MLKVTGASRAAATALGRVNPGLLLRHSGGLSIITGYRSRAEPSRSGPSRAELLQAALFSLTVLLQCETLLGELLKH